MTILNIQDDKCWKCGQPFKQDDIELSRTIHHTLPQQLSPVNNITVPIHEKCHKEITSQDVSSLTAHAYKLQKQVDTLTRSVEGLNNMLGKMTIIKIKNDK